MLSVKNVFTIRLCRNIHFAVGVSCFGVVLNVRYIYIYKCIGMLFVCIFHCMLCVCHACVQTPRECCLFIMYLLAVGLRTHCLTRSLLFVLFLSGIGLWVSGYIGLKVRTMSALFGLFFVFHHHRG